MNADWVKTRATHSRVACCRRDTVQNTDFHMHDFVAHFKKLSRTRTQTDPQVRNWTRPVLRADGESAHETSGIHQAEDIDEDGALAVAPFGSSSEPEVPANLRKPNPNSINFT